VSRLHGILTATALTLVAGCVFDSSGLSVESADGGDAVAADGVASGEGGQVLDAPGGDGLSDLPVLDDVGPGVDGTPDAVVDSSPTPDKTPDTIPPCPASCPIDCLPGGGSCPLPSNVSTGQLPTPCGAITLAKGSTWRLCSSTASCRLVVGTDCTVTPACAGKAVNQTTAISGTVIPACAFSLASLTIEVGATLLVRGPSPALVVVKGTALVAGTVDASAVGRYGGAGGGAGGKVAANGKGVSGAGPLPGIGGQTCNCQTNEDNYDDCGGGGGGFATVGGGGGYEGGKFCSAGPKPVGGVTYGKSTLVPLLGGSGGGSGDVGNAAKAIPGDGGGGGGAIQISAFAINLTGAVLANGGPGTGGASSVNTYPGGGGGAGSGGAILLEAVSFKGSGWTLAAGGGGGGGGDNCSASAGKQDKLAGGVEQPPAGGAGCSGGGDGGSGAFGAPSAAVGGQNAGIWQGPGGGGGGAGYLRFNRVGSSVTCPPPGLKTSGAVSCGAMSVKTP
jgi:hypothetical protein